MRIGNIEVADDGLDELQDQLDAMTKAKRRRQLAKLTREAYAGTGLPLPRYILFTALRRGVNVRTAMEITLWEMQSGKANTFGREGGMHAPLTQVNLFQKPH